MGQTYQQAVLADNPVMYLRLNETSGTTAADTSGNGHAGTYTGSNWVLGAAAAGAGLGTAVSDTVGGTGDFIDIPSSAALDITGDVTLEAWVYSTGLGQSLYIMSKGQTDATHGSYGMYVSATGHLVFACTEVANVLTGGTAMSSNTWYHVAGTRSGNTWTVYVNGAPDGSTTSAQTISATARNYRISGVVESGGTFFWWLGRLDEIALYNTALSAARISAHYAARGTASSGGATSSRVPSGQIVSAIVQARNEERKAQRDQTTSQRHRMSDYYRQHRRAG